MDDIGVKKPQQSAHFPDSFHRVTVKGLYVKDGKVLLSHDFMEPPPVWELPGGGLDFGETFHEGLRREIKEEMGLEVTWISEKPIYVWTSRRDKSHGMEWWYALVICYQIDIKTLDTLVHSDECRDIRFFSKEDLREEKDLNGQIKPLIDLFNPADFGSS